MNEKSNSVTETEIESLNLDDLTVEELERRLEMASLLAAPEVTKPCGVQVG